jgi:murein DD-endopeptidase MepM/ murein hydrolase activator NlpD
MEIQVALWALAALPTAANATPSGNIDYLLPFPPGQSHSLVQSFNGPYGHSGTEAYSYDFQAEIGSRVTAARAGTVIHVVESHPDAVPRHPEPGNENVIVIDHHDGSYARYYHLTRDGADVAVGAKVEAGQAIGRSGNSGASFMPHLHFDVTQGCFAFGCQTVRFRFLEIADDPLVAKRTYSR